MDLHVDLCHWFTVYIPKGTAKLTSLQRIMTLAEKSGDDTQILVHYEDGRAFFKFLADCSNFNKLKATELHSGPELHNNFILKYNRKPLVFENTEALFERFFPKGMGRRIKYESLPEMVKLYFRKVQVNSSEHVNNVCVEHSVTNCSSDKTHCLMPVPTPVPTPDVSTVISVQTGESLPDSPVDPKLEVSLGKIKQGDSKRCKPARDQYSLANKMLDAKEDIEQISYIHVYLKDPVRLAAGTKTSISTEEVTNDAKMLMNEEKHTGRSLQSGGYTTLANINPNASDEATDCSANISEDSRATQTGLVKEARNCMRQTNTNLLAAKQSKNTSRRLKFSEQKGSTFKETPKRGFMKAAKYKKKSAPKQASRRRKRNHHHVETPFNTWKGKEKYIVEKRKNDQEIVKWRQKKPFRNKGWSWNSDENLKQKYIFDVSAFTMPSVVESSYKYSKDIIKLLREFTDLLHHERSWKVAAHVYPSRRGKFSKSNQRRNQQGRTHSCQAPEGIQDQTPTQVSDAGSENLDLPPAELVQTSARSIFHTFTNNSPAPTTNMMVSIDAERSLVNRLHGVLPASRFSQPRQPPRHQQYSDQPSRQRSFANWPSTTGQDPSRMAIYGFFYTGRFDLIRCYQCGIGLKDWAAPDEPLFEHIKHSPDCQFLKDLLGQDLLNAYRDNLLANQLRQATSTSGSSTGSQAPATGRIRNPQYSELQTRLRSFDKWPSSSQQRPQALADAGLFYTGFNDLCRCFTCDGGLQRWDADDDPWIEHARWFPHCTYVRQIKGQDYINMVQQAAAQAREEEQDPAVVYPPPGRRAGPVEQGLADLTLQDTNPLNTQAAQSVIGMGYSRRAVLLAIHEYNGQAHGERDDYTAGDLVRILTERQDRGEALPPDSPRDSYSAAAAIMLPENMDPEEENRRLKGILKCMQCEENDTNILFLPCTHHRMCEECAENAVICPVCGRKIDDKIKTFMS